MSIHIKTGDAWHTCASVHVNVSGAWHTCKQVYINVSGTWKPCILVSQSKTINLGTLTADKTQSLSNVKKGSTIKITGNYRTRSYDGEGTALGVGRLYGLKATGATLPSNYGAYDGDNGWRFYNNLNGTYTLNLTATSTSVSITIRGPSIESGGYHKDCKITYTEEYYP